MEGEGGRGGQLKAEKNFSTLYPFSECRFPLGPDIDFYDAKARYYENNDIDIRKEEMAECPRGYRHSKKCTRVDFFFPRPSPELPNYVSIPTHHIR